MSKVFNNRLKGKELATSAGKIAFNAAGIADIQDEELVQKLLQLKGYSVVDTDSKEDEASAKVEQKQVEETPEAPKVEENSTEEESAQEDDESTSNDEEETADSKEDEASSDELSEENLSKLTVMQLKKIAADHDVDLLGATKKSEMIAIIIGAVNQ